MFWWGWKVGGQPLSGHYCRSHFQFLSEMGEKISPASLGFNYWESSSRSNTLSVSHHKRPTDLTLRRSQSSFCQNKIKLFVCLIEKNLKCNTLSVQYIFAMAVEDRKMWNDRTHDSRGQKSQNWFEDISNFKVTKLIGRYFKF